MALLDELSSCLCKIDRQNTEAGIRTIFQREKTYGMAQNKMGQAHTRRHQERRKDLVKNCKRKIGGTQKSLKMFCASTFVTRKQG